MMAGFDRKAYLKQASSDVLTSDGQSKPAGFDRMAYLKSATNPHTQDKYTEVESGLMGAAQGASLGFADELEGAARATYEKLSDPFSDSFKKVYEAKRDTARERYDIAESQNPKSFMAGEVGGGLATAFIPGAGVAKGASLLGSAAKMAAMGGVTAAGLSKHSAYKSPDDLEAFAKDVGLGAATGGITQAATGGLAKAGPALYDYLKSTAAQRAVKAATGQNKAVIKKAVKSGTLQSMGKHLLEEGDDGQSILSWVDKAETLGEKTEGARREYGKKIGEIAKQIDTAIPKAISGEKVGMEILAEAEKIPNLPHLTSLKNQIKQTADQVFDMGDLSFSDAQELKNQFKKQMQDHTQEISKKEMHGKIYDVFKKNMEETADIIAETHQDENVRQLLKNYKSDKARYATMKTLSEAAKDREAANLANRFVSPSDYGTGIGTAIAASVASGGASLPAIGLGLAAAGANKVARTYGSAFAAKTLNKAADILAKTPEVLGQNAPILKKALERGGASFAMTHQLLMAKDPGYQSLFKGEKQ
jgi:hypothetical protein